jgi:Fe-S-cluster containining protein
LLIDGRRSLEEVEHRLADEGAGLPPGVLDRIVDGLQRAGLLEWVETAWLPLQVLPWPEHRCVGCGGSCQGHWVGPLDPAFVARTNARLPALREKHPQLRDRRAFVRLTPGAPDLYLNSEAGQCLFLDPDRRCILHAEYGPAGKPAQCRMFPYQRQEDGRHTRLGVGLSCLHHFEQVVAGEAAADPDFWQAQNDTLDGRLYHYAPDGDENDLRRQLTGRSVPSDLNDLDALIAWVRQVDDPLADLLRSVTPRSVSTGRSAPARRVGELSRRHLAQLEACIADDPVVDRLTGLDGLYPARLAAVRQLARGAEAGAAPAPDPTSARAAKGADMTRLLRDALSRYLFLRRHRIFADLATGLAAFALGTWTALALSLRDAAQGTNDGRELDLRRFGQYFVAWWRPMQLPTARVSVFRDRAQVNRYLAAFQRFWRRS